MCCCLGTKRRIGQDIHRIGYDQKDALIVSLRDLGDNALENPHILVNQIQSRLLRLLIGPGSHNNDRRIHDVIIAPGVNFHLSGKRNPMRNVQRFPFRLISVRIQQYHFREQPALHQAERGCRPNETAAHDCHFSMIQ